MTEPSAKRQRTLALHDRALRFSNAVNTSCPHTFSNLPSRIVWHQLVRAALIKIRMGNLDNYRLTAERELESEASQLAAIFATIILNMRLRLEREGKLKKNARS